MILLPDIISSPCTLCVREVLVGVKCGPMGTYRGAWTLSSSCDTPRTTKIDKNTQITAGASEWVRENKRERYQNLCLPWQDYSTTPFVKFWCCSACLFNIIRMHCGIAKSKLVHRKELREMIQQLHCSTNLNKTLFLNLMSFKHTVIMSYVIRCDARVWWDCSHPYRGQSFPLGVGSHG